MFDDTRFDRTTFANAIFIFWARPSVRIRFERITLDKFKLELTRLLTERVRAFAVPRLALGAPKVKALERLMFE
jgi:hypothetical protein